MPPTEGWRPSRPRRAPGSVSRPYAEPAIQKSGNGRFEDVSDKAGTVFQMAEVGRGAAFGDIDNDGDVDVLVGNAAGRTRLLINEVGSGANWIGLRLIGAAGRDMLGARVEVQRSAGPTLWRRARSDGSYASANDPRVLIGLGSVEGRDACARPLARRGSRRTAPDSGRALDDHHDKRTTR